MVIEICSPRFPADSLKPRGKRGQSLVVDSFHFVGHYSNHTTVPRMSNGGTLLLPLFALLCLVSVGPVLGLAIKS
jgi:hypothetical protein